MAARIFAILAAAFLVAAIGVAALTPLGLTLAQGVMKINGTVLDTVKAHSFSWLWEWLELPFLLRPLWLLPACLGVVCAGIATSFSLGKASPSRRRRS